MLRRLALAALLALASGLAPAQQALIAPTAPLSANDNRIANTAWVQSILGGGGLPLASGKIFIGSAGNVAVAQTLTGDLTLSIGGVTTLATVNANVGTFGSATQCVTTTVNAKGLTTAISAATCTPAVGSITGLGTGIATALGINVGTAGSPVINGGALGTPASGTATNLTGLPISTGVSGLGTGVATALGVNVGTAGSPVVNGGALGTPSSGVGTNLTGTAASLTAGNATNVGITDDTTTNATMFPVWVTANTGNLPSKVTSTKLSFNPSTGQLVTSTLGVGTSSLAGYSAKIVGGNGTELAIDNTGQQFTEFDYYNNNVLKAATFWDQTNSALVFRAVVTGEVGFDTANTRRLTANASGATAVGYLRQSVTTVAGLPTCAGNEGARYGVTDATAGSAVFGTILVGGSTVHVSAYCNGTNWVGG